MDKKQRNRKRRQRGDVQLSENRIIVDSQRAEKPVFHVTNQGTSGTEIYGGYIAEDYLQALQGSERAKIYDRMRRSDTQVKMLLSAVKNVIKSAEWYIEEGDEDLEPISSRVKEFIEYVLFEDLGKPWKKFISEYLTFLDFGHVLFEITHKIVFNHHRWGTYNGFRCVKWLSPKTIERWWADENENLLSVDQLAYGDLAHVGQTNNIQAQYLIHSAIDDEGANFEGISLLRPCYGPWLRKDTKLKLNAIGIEKFAVPTPIAKFPPGKQNEDQTKALRNALESYTQHQSNYIMVPSGYEIDLKTNTYDPEKVDASIDREDIRMSKAFLANFLELGMNGKGGAYALSNDLSDFFLSGLTHIADIIVDGVNEKMIKPMTKMKFGFLKSYPKLKHHGIDDKAGKELAEVLHKLGNGKFIKPDDKLETTLRKKYRLPEQDPETSRETTQGQTLSLSERVLQAREKRA